MMNIYEYKTFSHHSKKRLKHLIPGLLTKGWHQDSNIYTDDFGFFSIDLHIEQKCVLFIDIEGVLIPNNESLRHYNFQQYNERKFDAIKLDKRCVQPLIQFLNHTGAVIAVHSRWRHTLMTFDDIKSLFTRHGFLDKHFYKQAICKFRGISSSVEDDIFATAIKPDISNWVVLDDRMLSIPAEHLIQVNENTGLLNDDLRRVESLLLDGVTEHYCRL
jgi:Swiss Army Knife RNA repair-like protein